MAAVTICSDFGAQKNKVSHVSPSICHEVMGPDAMILVFWMLSIKPPFSLSSFTFINRLFSSSLSAIRVVSSAYNWIKALPRQHILGGSKITADGECSHEIKRRLLLGRKVMTNLDSIFKSRDILFANKGPSSQGYVFSSGHVWMWELDCEESWAPKNWCF